MANDDGQPLPKRATRSKKDNPPLSPLPLETRRRPSNPMTDDDLFAEDDPYASNPPRPPSSAIRLSNPNNLTGSQRTINTTAQNPRTGQNPQPRRTMQQPVAPLPTSMQARPGRNITIPQPEAVKAHRNIHWLLYIGVGMLFMLTLWVVGSSVLAFGIAKYNDIVYGNPRTFQTNAVVGHGGDSPEHPSHFIAINLNRHIIVVELAAGNPANSYSYAGPYLFGPGGDLTPVTLEFRDVTHHGKPDMLIHIQDQTVVFVNDGTKFRPATPSDKIQL
jgi:hypothetical protein